MFIYIFFSLFPNSSCNFNEDIFHLVFASVIFAAFVGSVATSGVNSCVGILPNFFIGNNLLLKLSKT